MDVQEYAIRRRDLTEQHIAIRIRVFTLIQEAQADADVPLEAYSRELQPLIDRYLGLR